MRGLNQCQDCIHAPICKNRSIYQDISYEFIHAMSRQSWLEFVYPNCLVYRPKEELDEHSCDRRRLREQE